MGDWEKYLIKGDPLTKEQQRKADSDHARLAVQNEAYLASHPELKLVVSLLTRSILEARPSDPVQFAADFFEDANLPGELKAFTNPK